MQGLKAMQVAQTEVRQVSLRERLESRKKNLTDELSNVNIALDLLNENPIFEKIQDAITKVNVGFY